MTFSHTTLRLRKNPRRSVAPTAHQKPSGRQRSKSKESVKRPIRAHREIRVFDKSSPHGHSTSHMPHSTFHIQHPTLHTQHSTSNTPHSQHPSPKSTRFFPTAPHPASKNAILAHLCNHLTFNHLPSKEPVRYPTRPIPPHEKPCFAPPSLPFRGSISYLSRLDPLPFATRYMPNAPFRPSRCPLKTPK